MGLSKKLFSVIARRSLAKQSPQTNVDCDPSTPLRVTLSSFWTTPRLARLAGMSCQRCTHSILCNVT